MPSAETLAFAGALGIRALRIATLLGLGFVLLGYTARGRRYRVLALPWGADQLAKEAEAGLRVLAFDTVLAVLLWWAAGGKAGVARVFGGHGPVAFGLSFLALFVWYELWFYGVHRLLHTRWGWRWHRQHHTAVVCSPLTAFSFSLGERSLLLLGLLMFAGLGLLGVPLSAGGVAVYLMLNQLLNVIGHANVELTPRANWAQRAARWFVTPTFHALHHARRRAHYGLFTTVLDRCFGTVERDYAHVLTQTSASQPLRRIHSLPPSRHAADQA